MKDLPVYIPVSVLLSALLMLTVNVSAYMQGNWSWTNIALSAGIFLTMVAYVCMILKSIHFAWIQLLGTLASLLYTVPLFFRLFFAVVKGEGGYGFTFITVVIMLLLLSVVSLESLKIIGEKQKESSIVP